MVDLTSKSDDEIISDLIQSQHEVSAHGTDPKWRDIYRAEIMKRFSFRDKEIKALIDECISEMNAVIDVHVRDHPDFYTLTNEHLRKIIGKCRDLRKKNE